MEMLEIPNFVHMTAFDSRDKILMVASWTKIMTSSPLFQNNFISRRSRVAIFYGIIKIVTTFTKTIFTAKKKLKELEIMQQNSIYISIL